MDMVWITPLLNIKVIQYNQLFSIQCHSNCFWCLTCGFLTDFDEDDDSSSGGEIINDFSRFTKKPKTEEKDSNGDIPMLG